MPKGHRPYPAEFRQRIVELVRRGRTPEELGRQFEPSAQCIRSAAGRPGYWAAPGRADDGGAGGAASRASGESRPP
jgi:hypothetical protein